MVAHNDLLFIGPKDASLMKRVCICSSFKFYEELKNLESRLSHEIMADVPAQERSAELRSMTLKHFREIENSDIVFILTPNGYTGKSVCMEGGFANAHAKPIYSSSEIEDEAVRGLITGVLSTEELVKLCKE